MPIQCVAIIEAFRSLGGERSIKEISEWVSGKYGNQWKEFGTIMADMVPLSEGGNKSSSLPVEYRVLRRVSRGRIPLMKPDRERLS